MRKKIIQMTVCGWEAWAQSHKSFKPLWRAGCRCDGGISPHVWPFHIFTLSPLRGSQQSQWSFWGHSSALCATPSPHWLMDARCRGISAANSQQPPGKCWDNLWFHSWLSIPFPIPVPAWLMVSMLASRPMTPQRQNSASLLCSTIACCPIHHPTMSCFVGSSPKMLDLGLWVTKNPKSHIAQFSHHCLNPSQISPEVYKNFRFPAQVRTGGNKDYNRKQKTKSGKWKVLKINIQ